jgi:hypothetical protein
MTSAKLKTIEGVTLQHRGQYYKVLCCRNKCAKPENGLLHYCIQCVTSYDWPRLLASVSLLYTLTLPNIIKSLITECFVQKNYISIFMKNVLHLNKYQRKFHTFSQSQGWKLQSWYSSSSLIFYQLLHSVMIFMIFTNIIEFSSK